MTETYTVLIFTVFAAFHRIITLPGELLAPINKAIFNSEINGHIKKLLTCTKCLTFWLCLSFCLLNGLYILPAFICFIIAYGIEKLIV